MSYLTFTPSNWDVPQSVTVTGVNDGLDDGNQKFEIKISVVDSSSDGAFATQADQKLSVTNLDNDDDEEEEEEEEEVEELAPVCVVGFGSVVESSGSTVMSEGGSSDSFTFALASQPGSSVVVSVVSSDLSEASVSVSSLTFGPSNWDVPQSVTVTGVNDGLDDGDQSVNIVLSADGFENVAVGVVNADNDGGPSIDVSDSSGDSSDGCPTPAEVDDEEEEEEEEEVEELAPVCVVGFGSVVESSGSTVMSESGSSDSFTFALASQPGSSVVVSVVSSDLSEASVSVSSLTFGPSNWDVPQSVTVTGVNDGLDDGDQSVNIVLSADGFENVAVGVVNADNDGGPSIDVSDSSGDSSDGCPTPAEVDDEEEEEEEVEELALVCVVGFGSVVESSGSTVMSESGSSDSFTFALASQYGSSVVVSVVSSDLSEASVSVSSLTFGPSNWDVPQSVTVTGVNDGLDDGDQSVNIVLSADGFENVAVGVVNADNDGGPSIDVSDSSGDSSDGCPTPAEVDDEEEEEEEEEVEELALFVL